jgi:AcrR family transcriptional regulator
MKSKERREEQHAAIRTEIKAAAWKLMAAEGTAGLSMRAIGREMGLSATALYHYYPSKDALITDLILDAFNALGDAVEAASASATGAPLSQQITTTLLAYRAWALAHPLDFQLIYGNPIPGYEAPSETTVPAAERSFRVLMPLIYRALAEGQGVLSEPYRRAPEALTPFLQALATAYPQGDVPRTRLAAYLNVIGWTRIHGVIMLELFNHIQPVIGDTQAFYEAQIQAMLKDFGLEK